MAIKKDNRPEPAWIRLRRNRFLTVGIISLVLLCSLAGLAFARYMRSLHSGVSVRVKEFYFTSNLLDGETHTLAPGTDSITFTLGNHGDELRHSEVDIDYTVTVENPAGTVPATVAPGPHTLAKNSKASNEVTISNLKPGRYIVTATGKGEGYTQELTAVIVVPEETTKVYQYLDRSESEYSVLTVWNEGNTDKTVTVTYTGIPDNTNPDMGAWKIGGPGQDVTIASHGSKVFRFFDGVASASDAEYRKPN